MHTHHTHAQNTHTQQTCTANAGMCVCTNLYVHTCKNAHMYAHAHCIHMCTDRQTSCQTYTYLHTCMRMYVHMYTHIGMHTHTCMHAHPHTPHYIILYMCIKSSGSQIYVHTYTIIYYNALKYHLVLAV